MADVRIRRQLALLAARLMYDRDCSEYFTAKRKAARQLGVDPRGKPGDLPTNAEIRDEVQRLADLYEGDSRQRDLRAMRLAAYRMMRTLEVYRPRLIGSVLTGHVRRGSDVDIHVFADNVARVADLLLAEQIPHDVERKRVRKFGVETVYTHVHARRDGLEFELTVYPEDKAHYAFKSSITGKAIERASLPELKQHLLDWYPDLDAEALDEDLAVDANSSLRSLLLRLEGVKQDPRWHPEGDALYHSLQVFERMREARAWDAELLSAALLHDVGKGIDPHDHVAAGVDALRGLVSDRTLWLIAHHMDAQALHAGDLGRRAADRLRGHPDFDDLLLLAEADRAGRVPGAAVGTVDEALDLVAEAERGEVW
jgi:predicted nucleotidyltransferase